MLKTTKSLLRFSRHKKVEVEILKTTNYCKNAPNNKIVVETHQTTPCLTVARIVHPVRQEDRLETVLDQSEHFRASLAPRAEGTVATHL